MGEDCVEIFNWVVVNWREGRISICAWSMREGQLCVYLHPKKMSRSWHRSCWNEELKSVRRSVLNPDLPKGADNRNTKKQQHRTA